MSQPDFESAKQYALGRLERELSPLLSYHSLGHTQHDVVPASERLAAMEGVEGEALLLLLTAAYYHDLGFVEQRTEHEAAGVRIAEQTLPNWDYEPAHIRTIDGIIMATQLPQTPHTLLEKLMADADMDSLGREDFMPRSWDLRAELAAFGHPTSEEEWLRSQLEFLQNHRYFTTAARTLRDEKKQQNIELLIHLIAVGPPAP